LTVTVCYVAVRFCAKAIEDALHIAILTLHHIDFLLTWKKASGVLVLHAGAIRQVYQNLHCSGLASLAAEFER
jgi:hypothetical protein